MQIKAFKQKQWMFFFMTVLTSLLWSSFVPVRFGRAQSPFQVALVIQNLDSVETKCVELNKPNPTGYDVLLASGAALIVDANSMGTTICSINNIGCPANDCFCQSYAPPYYYWSYWHLKNGNWVYSNMGASNYLVKHGDVEAWLWGDARTPPQKVTFEEICGSPSLPTASPSSTSTPSLTMTSFSTLTPSKTATTSPTLTPEIFGTMTATRKPALSRTSISTNTPSLFPPQSTLLASNTFTIAAPDNARSYTSESATPSPTITLAYSFLTMNTPIPETAQEQPSITQTPTFDLNRFSLTATAIANQRQSTFALETNHPIRTESTSILHKSGWLSFAGFVGGLILLWFVFQRSRRG